MYAIMGEVMTARENTLFASPVGSKYMMQEVWESVTRAEEHARALATRTTNMKFWVVEMSVESFWHYPPQEKKYAAVFD